MKIFGLFLFSSLFFLAYGPQQVHALGAAPELYNVGEIIINYVKFEDPNGSDSCGLSREQIASSINNAFKGTTVPAMAVIDAKPPMVGVARIQLYPVVSTHIDENMNCASWISMSAESRANVIIPPVSAPRNVTIVYWRQHNKTFSGQSLHPQKVAEVLKKMIEQLSQQYRIDQPLAVQK